MENLTIEDKARSRSWFITWNNPQDLLQGEVEEITEKALEMWVQDKPTRSGAVAFCISAHGLKHFHMVLEDTQVSRWSAVKKIYPKANILPTKGNKEQAENYIQKKGKYAEKGEEVVYIARHGEIKANQGQRKDLEIIDTLLQEGKTPNEILDMNFNYRRFEKLIKDGYRRKREKETPFIRDLTVYYHVGKSGSGKSYTCADLIDKYGEENVYLLSDYESGGLDNYMGQKVLFMDEFRGQIRFSTLLGMLQGYKQQFHARYTNIVALWNEVHITSVLPIEKLYENMVSEHKAYDTIEQLKRRINFVVYHYKENDDYKQKVIPMSEYTSYRDIMDDDSVFVPVNEQMVLPFD